MVRGVEGHAGEAGRGHGGGPPCGWGGRARAQASSRARHRTGVRVVTQARVPFEAGLGSAGALAVAVGAAAARVKGRTLREAAVAALSRHGGAVTGADPRAWPAGLAAVWGGVVAEPGRATLAGSASASTPRGSRSACSSWTWPAAPRPDLEAAGEPRNGRVASPGSGAVRPPRHRNPREPCCGPAATAEVGGPSPPTGGPTRLAPEHLGRGSTHRRTVAAVRRERRGVARSLWPGPESLVLGLGRCRAGAGPDRRSTSWRRSRRPAYRARSPSGWTCAASRSRRPA